MSQPFSSVCRSRILSTGISAIALLGGCGAATHAATLPATISPDADNGGGSHAGRADIITITGTSDTISGDYALRGTSARRFEFVTDSIAARNARGEVISGYDAVAGRTSVAVGAQQRTVATTYPDQIEGANASTLVYDNALLVAVDSTSAKTATIVDTGAPVYGDLRLANIAGSAVTIATGDPTASVYADRNFAILTADSGSTLYDVTAGSRIVYASRTATMDGADQDRIAQGASTSIGAPVTTYSGVAFGNGDAVTDLDALKRYNTALIAQLTAGSITPQHYDDAIRAAAITSLQPVTVRTPEIPPYTAPTTISSRLFMRLDASSLVTAAGSQLVGVGVADGNNDGVSTLILAQNGSSIVNNGMIVQGEIGVGIRVQDAGSTLLNAEGGVIGVGYETIDRSGGTLVPTGLSDYQGAVTGNIAIRATDGSVVSNRGIVNVSNRDIAGHPEDQTLGKANDGIVTSSGAIATNSGTILIGGAASAVANARGLFDGAAGMVAFGGAVVNDATGVIRIGTTFAETGADLAAVTDVLSTNYAAGLVSLSGGGTVVNNGTIRIGSLAQNATGILVGGDGDVATNTGRIAIDASALTIPAARNAAISVLGGSVAGALEATNATGGSIVIDGVNSVGLLVENQVAGGSARAVNAGTITINGGVSVDRLRNFAVFVGNDGSSAVQDGAIVLVGEGAIGVHARDGGTVDVGSGGTVAFRGVDQIGYYLLGAGSTIRFGAASTDVATSGSTGVRVEGGAALSGAGLDLTVSGADAFGLVASGGSIGPTIDTGTSTIRVTGNHATGVVVEGGATGLFGGNITLAGVGATAAIVDGQAHDLDGVANGAPLTTTRLTSRADLASDVDGLTGYIARNTARLTTSGTIEFGGVRTTGILATTGASVVNTGAVTIGAGGTGIRLISAGDADAVTGDEQGSITATGGSIATRTRAIQADGAGATATLRSGSTIILAGDGAIGADAIDGGHIVLATGVVPRFDTAASDQIAFHAAGPGATITGAGGTLDASGTRATLFRFDDGATATFDAATALAASGAGATAIVAADAGTAVATQGTGFAVSGAGASGLAVYGGASATMDAATTIALAAAGTGATVDGRTLALDATIGAIAAATLSSAATVTGGGDGARGYAIADGGTLIHSGTIVLTGRNTTGIAVSGAGSSAMSTGSIDLRGQGVGVDISDGGTFAGFGSVAVASGTGVLVSGAGSHFSGTGLVTANDGVAALRLVDNASVDSGADVAAGGTAHGVLVDAGAGALTLRGGRVSVSGTGNGIENAAGSSAITLVDATLTVNGSGAGVRTAVAIDPASTATIDAAGAGSVGFAFTGTNGTAATGDIAFGDGLAITASGVGATGILLNGSGTATVAGTVRVTASQGGSALVGGPTASILNTGSLVSSSIGAPVVDIAGGITAFTNSGTIAAATSTDIAIQGGDAGQAVTLSGGGVTGAIRLGAGADDFVMTGGTLVGSLSTGGGNDSATFRGLSDANLAGATGLGGDGVAGGADTLTFEDTQSTGTRRLTGWNTIALVDRSTLTSDGDLVLAGGRVTIDATSTLFAGNRVNGKIAAADGGALALVNAGTIDLGNGSNGAGDTLTVRGDYVGQSGTLRLDTVLGATGSLSDRLVIDGGTVSGTTAIRIVDSGGLGVATVGNGIEVIAATNGGRTTATTGGAGFTLAGGHVDAGAFEYRLYASDPAGSESFYLRTAAASVPADPGTPTAPPAPAPTTYRVEVPLLAALPAQLRAGDLAMLGTYHQRIGDRDRAAADGFSVPGRIWGRFIADDVHRKQGGDARPTSDGHGRGAQLGVDLFTFGTADGEHHVGLFGGYLHDRVQIDGFSGGVEHRYAGRLDPRATYAGGYWTYLAKSGFYVDTVIQRSWYSSHALAANGNRIGIDGTGVLASVETGWGFALSPVWTLEPQAQIIAQGVSIADVAIPDATVRQRSPGYLTGRLGARLVGSFGSRVGAIQPYIRANLWKGFRSTDRTIFTTTAGGTLIRTQTSSLFGEGGAGVTWPIARAVVLYGEADHRFTLSRDQGESGRATTGSVGARVRF